jgi:hypothetical protein
MNKRLDWTDLAPEVFKFREAGMSVHAIAEKIGVSIDAFYEWRKRENIILPRIKGSRLILNEDSREMLFVGPKRSSTDRWYKRNREAILIRRRIRRASKRNKSGD